MRIDSKIVSDDNKILGYILDDTADGGDKYPISTQALYNREIFHELINRGYSLVGPNSFQSPQGVLIEELPTVAFTTLTENEKKEMFVVDDLLSESEANTFLTQPKKESSEKQAFKPAEMVLIRSRQDLIDFARETTKYDKNDPKTFLPVNMITDKSALFTVEEIMQDQECNEVFGRLLEKCTYSLAAFEHQKKYFRENLEWIETDNYMDYIKFYLSWGIPGVTCTYDKLYVHETQSLLSSLSGMNEPVAISKQISALYTKDGNYVSKPHNNFNPSRKTLAELRKRLPERGVGVVHSYIPATTEILSIVNDDGFSFMIDGPDILVKYTGYVSSCHTFLGVYDLNNSRLPKEYWATGSDDAKQRFFDRMLLSAVVRDYFRRITVLSNGTTHKALATAGLDLPSAMEYLAYNMSKSTSERDGDNDEKDKLRHLNMYDTIKHYFRGNIENYFYDESAYEEYISDFISGETVLNSICDGREADNSNNSSSLINELSIVIRDLDLDMKYVIKQFDEIDLENGQNVVELAGKGYVFHVVVIPRDNEINGFGLDILRYRAEAYREASNLLYVTKVYTEPADTKTQAKHVAFEAVMLDTRPKIVKEVLKQYEAVMLAEVLKKMNVLNAQPSHYDRARIMATQVLMSEIASFLQNTNTTGNSLVNISSVIRYAQLVVTTTAQCLANTHKLGTWRLACVNAIITPHWVVPRAETEICAYPIFTSSKSLSPAVVEQCRNAGFLPWDYKMGIDIVLEGLHPNVHLVDPDGEKYETAESLRAYHYRLTNSKFTANGFVKPANQYNALYPNIRHYIGKDSLEERTVWPDKYRNIAGYKINNDELCEISEYVKWLLEPVHANKSGRGEDAVSKYTGLTAEQLISVGTYTALINFCSHEYAGAKLVNIVAQGFEFEDGSIVGIDQVLSFDLSGKAVYRVNGNTLVMMHVDGELRKVVF